MLDVNKIPRHIAIIMDGNRRWAKKHGLAVLAGHKEAVDKTVESLIERAGELGVKHLTLWAFSTENWERSQEEVGGLMKIFRHALVTKVPRFIKKGARLAYIGDISRFDTELQERMKKAKQASVKNTKITVTFALNYGGRDEIRRAVKKLLSSELYKERNFVEFLDTAGMPEPDLIIRTGGERRTSGFLMWSAPYAEWYFVDTLFPDFSPKEFDLAIEDYQNRQRRFGR